MAGASKFFLLSFFLILIDCLAQGQTPMGYRWAKPVGIYNDFNSVLASKFGKLYSTKWDKINRHDSLGNTEKSFSISSIPNFDNIQNLQVSSKENFLVRSSNTPPIWGVGGFSNLQIEKFLYPIGGQNYMYSMIYYPWDLPWPPKIIQGELFNSTQINEKDLLFTHVSTLPIYSGLITMGYESIYQLADTNISIKWRKKICSNRRTRFLNAVGRNGKLLVTAITDSSLTIDSSLQIPVSGGSIVHLSFNENGDLETQRIIPNNLPAFPASFYFKEILLADQSIIQFSANLPNNGIYLSRLNYFDSTGTQQWSKTYSGSGYFSNLFNVNADNEGNLLCFFSPIICTAQECYSQPSFLILNRNGQKIWADSSEQKINNSYFDEKNLCNLGRLNWVVRLHSKDSISIGPFHQALPQYEKQFLLNIREISPLTISSDPKFCVSDQAKINILNTRASGISGVDSFYVFLSDSTGDFGNQILLTKSISSKPSFVFPAHLPAGNAYRFRVYSVLGQRFGPPSPAVAIGMVPQKPIVSSATGIFSTCLNTPLALTTYGNELADFIWSSGEKERTASARLNAFNTVTAILGGCQAKSDSVFVKGIRDIVYFSFNSLLCESSSPVQLSASPDSGFWSGPQLDSTKKYFLPQLVSDTLSLRYRDTTNAQCPIDTLVQIFQMVRPPLPPILPDTQFCQQAGKIKLPSQSWTHTLVQ
jgi:hypothetical protein